jgi:hypothetical protein
MIAEPTDAEVPTAPCNQHRNARSSLADPVSPTRVLTASPSGSRTQATARAGRGCSEPNGGELGTLILEVKGYDERAEVKSAAAKRWCAAVNADAQFGKWDFRMVRNPADSKTAIDGAVQVLAGA